MNKKDRTKTNSVTHLVKIIAEEVAEEVFERKTYEIFSRLEKLEKIHDHHCNRKSFDRVGENWSLNEVEDLRHELETSINNIAESHGRTKGAIKSRIKQEGFIYNSCF